MIKTKKEYHLSHLHIVSPESTYLTTLHDNIIPLSPDKNIPNALEILMQNSKKPQLPFAKSCTLRSII